MRVNLLRRVLVMLCLVLAFFLSYAQERTITGIITDENGSPLTNATVTVKGTRVSATTGATGAFTISVPANATTLTVSYVGMTAQDVSIEGQSSVRVSLQAA